MDEKSQIIGNFEAILNNNTVKRTSLYNNNNEQYSRVNQSKHTYSAKDIIRNISCQIKAIQNADCARSEKHVARKFNLYNKSTYLPVNMLSINNEVLQKKQTNINRFETQCVSDTQLIHIIEDAEALHTHKGITQEFDITFSHIHLGNENPEVSGYKNMDLKDYNSNKIIDNHIVPDLDSNESNQCLPVDIEDHHNQNYKIINLHKHLNEIHNQSHTDAENGENCNKGSNDCFNTNGDEFEYDSENIFGADDILETRFTHTHLNKVNDNDRLTNLLEEHNETSTNTSKHVETYRHVIEHVDTHVYKENTQMLNESIEIERNKSDLIIDRSASPILKIKSTFRKSNTPFPLVYSLEMFEKFESIALPIVEEDLDINTTKKLINSQILGKELSIQTDTNEIGRQKSLLIKSVDTSSVFALETGRNLVFDEYNKQTSPIFNVNNDKLILCSNEDLRLHVPIKTLHRDILAIEQDEISKFLSNNVGTHRKSSSLEDEILFSSDEEDYIHKEKEDLPLTCALETSFYETADMLDKTMYVGFQTANDKSIQINTDSYLKAKSFLHDIEKDIKESTLSEMVIMYDDLTRKHGDKTFDNYDGNGNAVKSHCNIEQNEIHNKIVDLNDKPIKEHNSVKELKYMGFKTANGKAIKTFEDAINKSEVTFQDMDDNNLLQTDFFKRSTGSKQVIKFEGFKTASNKKIKLSEKAFARCKHVFEDIDFDTRDFDAHLNSSNNKEAITHTEYEGKKPTMGTVEHIEEIKSIDDCNLQICDENLIKEFENSILPEDISAKTNNDIIQFKIASNGNIKTASNGNIKISDAALEKIKNIFQDIDLTENFNVRMNDINTADKRDLNEDHNKVVVLNYPNIHNIHNEYSLINVKSQFQSFKTANNKMIKISKQALANTKNIFQDIDLIDLEVLKSRSNKIDTGENTIAKNVADSSQPRTSKTGSVRFKEANNKVIKILEQIPAETKTIFKDIDSNGFEISNSYKDCVDITINNKVTADYNMPIHMDFNQPSTSKTNCVVFKTANNKPVHMSKTISAKTKNIFQEIDSNDADTTKTIIHDLASASKINMPSTERDINTPSTNINFIDFKTASNKPITISEGVLARTKNIFKDIDEFEEFKTASNKKDNISTEALTKNEKSFEDANYININLEKNTEASTNNNIYNNTQSATFFHGCGNNNPIKISKETLTKSKKQNTDLHEDMSNNSYPKTHNLQTMGFPVTASNKRVIVSKDALVKSPIFFEEIENIHSESTINVQERSYFEGFKTANNEPVKMSTEALTKCRKVSNVLNIGEEKSNNISVAAQITTPKFSYFRTGGKKRIDLSEEALAKSKKMLEEIDNYKDNNSCNAYFGNIEAPFGGFQTASNKKVNISEQALAKTKQLLQNIDVDNNKIIGFKTANDRKIEVSETALTKSKDLFKDLENENFDGGRINIGFKTGNNNNIRVSKDALEKSRKLFSDLGSEIELVTTINKELKVNNDKLSNCEEANIKNLINTQVMHNFEESLYTEDFNKSPKLISLRSLKRSGSPILSCPRAKKCKRFETPYKNDFKTNSDKTDKSTAIQEPTCVKVYTFDKNYKKNKIFTLKDLDKLEKESSSEPESDIYFSDYNNFDSNLLCIKFSGNRNDLTDNTLSIEELKGIFLDSVNRKIIPDGWMDNHLKIILWKLIRYERRFPKILTRVCTVKNVIEQLKFRYNRELYNVERPALRKILEKDDTSMKTIVLCVIGIYVNGVTVTSITNTNTRNMELLLSDGWYCIKGCIDKMLSKLVCENKIKVGTKIVTHGAELLNCDQGIAPWEDTSSVRLKLFGNSTRRARWDARLGYHGHGAILSQLSKVTPDGGKVAKLQLYVTRVYPTLYVEKFEDGSTVTRSQRLENFHQMKYEADRQALLEKIYEEVEKELSDQESQHSGDSGNRKCLDTGSQIAKVMKNCTDPSEFITHLTSTQSKLLEDHTSKQRDKLVETINSRVQQRLVTSGLVRNVVTLVKIRVAAVDENGVAKGMMSIWRPNEATLEILTEGTWIDVLNVVPTAIRYSEIQISAGRQSIFGKSKYKESDKIETYISSLKRNSYTIKDLKQKPIVNTDYNEIDTSGFIFLIDPSITDFESAKHQFQNMYLTDADKNIICVNFWGGIKKFGFENMLDTGQVISCVNLQKRAGNSRKNIPQYRPTEFTYFTRTPKNASLKKLQESLTKKFVSIDKKKFCEDCVAIKNNYAVFKYNENTSPYSFNNLNLSKNKVFIKSPLLQKNSVDPNLNLTGLDFDSTFLRDSQEISPKTLQRKRKVNEKIAKLKMIGEPPPLNHIHLINKSMNATNSYKSPVIPKNDVSSVASVNKTETSVDTEKLLIQSIGCSKDNQSSSVLNRTLVKRKGMNPVKLNFSSVTRDVTNVDNFAEDFDGSPPLSLDSY